MVPLESLLAFAIASVLLILIPGPSVLFVIGRSIALGRRAGVLSVVGNAIGMIPAVLAVALGVGALVSSSIVAFTVIKIIGAVYLVWLGVQLWRSIPEAATSRSVSADVSPSAAFVRSLGVALSNPKGLLFFSAFLPQFIDTSQPQAMQYLVLAVVSAALDAAVMVCYAAGGSQAAKLLTANGLRHLNRSCAAAMFSLAAFLALYRRTGA